MTPEDRARVIESLFDELTRSAFAEDCEDRILAGLESRTDEQLMAYAEQKLTWRPTVPPERQG